MEISMQSWVSAYGLSGLEYRYWPCDRFGDWLELPANYEFAKFTASTCGWTIFYIGEAANIRDRMLGHERWLEAVGLGATHVLAHVSSASEVVRRAEERDLIARYNPPLNVQHRTNAILDLVRPAGGPANALLGGLGFAFDSLEPRGRV
jgi:hypothetical protein